MSRFDRNWHVHSTATLPSGGRVFIAHISSSQKWSTAAVLMADENGLSRIYRGGRRTRLAPDFVYPRQGWDADLSLRSFAPKHWGAQRGSMCVVQKIPARLLAAKTRDLARLLLAWYRVDQKATLDAIRRDSDAAKSKARVSVPPIRRPVAVSIVPSTDLVVRFLHDGVLVERLKLGLERIYVSTYALIRAPSIAAPLRALEKRFPDRLIVVPYSGFFGQIIAKSLRASTPRAIEYVVVGNELSGAYQRDFGFDKITSPGALADVHLFRVGDVPRGVACLFSREIVVPYQDWKLFDIDGMQASKDKAVADFEAQERRGLDLFFGKEN